MKRFLSILLVSLLLLQVTAPCLAFAGDDWSTDPIDLDPTDDPIVDESKIVFTADTCRITLPAESFAYTGKAITPAITVDYLQADGTPTALTAGSDYSLRFRDNTAPGKALVTVTGTGDYSGSVSKAFAIVPPKMRALKAGSITYRSVKTAFVRVEGADAYQLCIAPSGTLHFKYYDSDGKKAFVFSDLKDNTKYKLRIRASVEVDGQRYYGPFSDYITVKTKPAVEAPTLTGFCQLNALPELHWNAVKGATKYFVYRSTSKNGTYTRIATTKKLAFTDKKVKLHKTYYYVVRAYTLKGGKAYVSVLSNKVKIQSKKTVFVGDSVMEGVRIYHGYDAASYVTKVGVGTYTFYNSNYFTVGDRAVTGVEKVISYSPERVFIMLGMNEMPYKSHAAIFEYYRYIIEDIREACPGVQIVILPVSPTKPTAPAGYPKKGAINSYNKDLKAFTKKMGCSWYDYTPAFKDADGYLLDSCDGGDGCHWNPYSAKLFITQIQKYIKIH